MTAFVLTRAERLKVQETAEALLNHHFRHDLDRIWGIGRDHEAPAP